jgi:hypothetical protein
LNINATSRPKKAPINRLGANTSVSSENRVADVTIGFKIMIPINVISSPDDILISFGFVKTLL